MSSGQNPCVEPHAVAHKDSYHGLRHCRDFASIESAAESPEVKDHSGGKVVSSEEEPPPCFEAPLLEQQGEEKEREYERREGGEEDEKEDHGKRESDEDDVHGIKEIRDDEERRPEERAKATLVTMNWEREKRSGNNDRGNERTEAAENSEELNNSRSDLDLYDRFEEEGEGKGTRGLVHVCHMKDDSMVESKQGGLMGSLPCMQARTMPEDGHDMTDHRGGTANASQRHVGNTGMGLSGGPQHHLTRHWLLEESKGEVAQHRLGASSLKESELMIKNMSQRELRAAFMRVYGSATSSYNNNWMRRKLYEAVGSARGGHKRPDKRSASTIVGGARKSDDSAQKIRSDQDSQDGTEYRSGTRRRYRGYGSETRTADQSVGDGDAPDHEIKEKEEPNSFKVGTETEERVKREVSQVPSGGMKLRRHRGAEAEEGSSTEDRQLEEDAAEVLACIAAGSFW